MKHLTLIITLCNFFSYIWSVIGVFKKNKEKDKIYNVLFQVNSVAIWIAAVFSIYNSNSTDIVYLLLGAIQTICLLLFWQNSNLVKKNNFSIVFSKDVPQKLIKNGLYKRIRHPFYTIYLLCYFSVGIFMNDPYVIALSLTMLIIYYKAASMEEKKFLSSKLSEQYLEYRKETYMFFPKY